MERKVSYSKNTAMLQEEDIDRRISMAEIKIEAAKAEGNGSPFNVNEKKIMLKALNGLAASISRAKTKDINDPELVAVRDKQLREISALITKEMFHEAR